MYRVRYYSIQYKYYISLYYINSIRYPIYICIQYSIRIQIILYFINIILYNMNICSPIEYAYFVDAPSHRSLVHVLTSNPTAAARLTLNCSARGVETPVIRWSRVSGQIPAAATVSQTVIRTRYTVVSSLEFNLKGQRRRNIKC